MPRIARLTDVDPPEWRSRLAYRTARTREGSGWEHVVVVTLDDPSVPLDDISVVFVGAEESRSDRLDLRLPVPRQGTGLATSASTGRSRRAQGSTVQATRQAGSTEIEFTLRPRPAVTSFELAVGDLGLRSAVFALD